MSSPNTEFKRISARCKKLLDSEENFDVDFKESVEGLKSEDIVAFANSLQGGAILIGVKENPDKSGMRKGLVKGCKVSEPFRTSIISKAESCSPPIKIKVFKENLSAKPFFRVEIDSSSRKPHCTQGGIYKTRADSRNAAITPDQLLEMFLELEANEFLVNFNNATKKLEEQILSIDNSIYNMFARFRQTLFNTADQITDNLEDEIRPRFEEIDSMMKEIQLNLDEEIQRLGNEADETGTDIYEFLQNLEVKLDHIRSLDQANSAFAKTQIRNEQRLLALLSKFDIEDPELGRLRKEYKFYVLQFLVARRHSTTEKASWFDLKGSFLQESNIWQFSEDEINSWIKDLYESGEVEQKYLEREEDIQALRERHSREMED